ncbi:MAG: arginine N-succinyltransferase [Plesiomonas sp.]|uniref:arginine N-succinyltransferase n=1 Tax=Plesiomonas sp. TaxID=2486279 RepID=UPI003EE74E8A
MLIIRPVCSDDLAALMHCAQASGFGFTSLPADETRLSARITHAERSFAAEPTSPGDYDFLFVAQESDTGQIIGTTAIESCVGLEHPFYSYHRAKAVHVSKEINVYKTVETLTLSNDYTGSSELCTLFLLPEYRKGLYGKLLSKCRLLFIAEFADCFADTVIAEMRGVSDESGHSPFFQWLRTHFFDIDFSTADRLTGTGNKRFIAELMPRHPIYINLLSAEAQAVIGQVHTQTRPALQLLLEEGFHHRNYVDIFDAGPSVECAKNEIRAVRQSRRMKSSIIEDSTHGSLHLITSTRFCHFRACLGMVSVDEELHEAHINASVAHALEISDGDRIRILPL